MLISGYFSQGEHYISEKCPARLQKCRCGKIFTPNKVISHLINKPMAAIYSGASNLPDPISSSGGHLWPCFAVALPNLIKF
jgi:hypothetical protein